MIIYYLIAFVLGLVALISGSDLLVRKSEFLAHTLKVEPILIGIFLLGMGTSAPEWAVSTISATRGLSELAVANVIGSNIFNILVVLGVILLRPLARDSQTRIKKDLLFLLGTSFLILPLFLDRYLSRLDAFLLVIIFLIYILSFLWKQESTLQALQDSDNYTSSRGKMSAATHCQEPRHNKQANNSLLRALCFTFLGFVLLISGSYITVYGAEHIGEYLGISPRVMGILMVSVGTSLPELFTCLSAFLKGYKNMAIGNIIGSNIFNTYAVLSTAGLILPIDIPKQMITLDIPIMLFSYFLVLVLVFPKLYQALKAALPYLFFSLYIVYVFGLLFLI